MRVAGIQLDIAWEDPRANLVRSSELVAQAASTGARLIALPEMFATGFSMRAGAMARHAESILEQLSSMATTHGVYLLGGLVVPGEERPENIAVIIDPAGNEIARYSKLHPFSMAGEDQHFTAGRKLTTVEIEGVRVTPLICYDLRFPEPFRAAAQRTDLFVVIANWPIMRALAWRTLLAARAIDCLAFVLGVNRVGSAEDLEHRGDTALIDPLGEVLASRAHQEGLIVGSVDIERVQRVREQLGFLNDRRVMLYRDLEE
ncbi:MAG: carbon-nitrogen family hydrolase [bacterium]|nr:carbon-nitrogen family hydrolase [bacterium]